MPFHPLARNLFGYWGNRSRVRGNRRRAGVERRAAALELLEPRTMLSAVTALGLDLDEHAGHRVAVDCLPPEPRQNRMQAALVPAAAPPFDLADTFFLHSDPDADHTIYLDFNGHITTGTAWLGGATIDSPAYNFEGDSDSFTASELERIQKMWLRVVEDFAPFNVNVTTEEPDIERLRNTGGGDTQWGVRVVITPSNEPAPGAGGVAYLYSFNDSIDLPAFVFNVGETGASEAISHEVGHTLGLSHDGRFPNEEYYGGHGSGATSWSPIMGVGYYTQISQWSRGEYPSADETQDDLDKITNPNTSGWQGLTYRADDHADDFFGATELVSDGVDALVAAGLISTRGDQDVFRFTTSAGAISIDVSPWIIRPNLDIELTLLNSMGQVLELANPFSQLGASITRILGSGTYFLRIDGVGKIANGSDYGYSDYGSLGQYSIRVTSATAGEDLYEENDTRPSAADPRSNGGLWEGQTLSTIKGFGVAADVDFYQIFVPDTQRFLIADLIFIHSAGDLALQVVDSSGRVVRTSASVTDNEGIQILLPSGGMYFLRVSQGADGLDNVYDLSWTSIPEPLRVTGVQLGFGNNRWVSSNRLDGTTSSWAITKIRYFFNRDVLIDIADLTASSQFGSNLRFASFHYDPVRFIAVWTLADPIERDRVQFSLDGDSTIGDSSDGVRAASGANYLFGGDFELSLSILEGDVNGDGIVNVYDRIIIRNRWESSYARADVNGDGIVDIADASLTLSHEGWTL